MSMGKMTMTTNPSSDSSTNSSSGSLRDLKKRQQWHYTPAKPKCILRWGGMLLLLLLCNSMVQGQHRLATDGIDGGGVKNDSSNNNDGFVRKSRIDDDDDNPLMSDKEEVADNTPLAAVSRSSFTTMLDVKDIVSPYLDVVAFNSNDDDSPQMTTVSPPRMLQSSTTTTTTTTTTCANISDGFRTLVMIAYDGNSSLVTNDQASLLGVVFAETYNAQRSTSSNSDDAIPNGNTTTTTTTCDPLFRAITSVQATTNARLSGSYQGEYLANPLGNIIPVRKLGQQQQQEEEHEDEAASLLEHLLQESLVKVGLINTNSEYKDDGGGDGDGVRHNSHARKLQQQPGAVLPAATSSSSGLNRTVGNFNVGLILLEVFGSCRGCQGNSPEFTLFDDTSSFARRQRRRQLRGLQEDVQDPSLLDCSCPSNSVPPDDGSFQTSLNANLDELRETGELELIEGIEQVFPVQELTCPTIVQDFSTVYVTPSVEFSIDLLYTMGIQGAQAIEQLARDSYNGIAQQLCDPLFRTISEAKFASVIQIGGEKSPFVTFEFVIDAICRGDNCTSSGCLFDEVATGCGQQPQEEEQGGRKLWKKIERHDLMAMSKNFAKSDDAKPATRSNSRSRSHWTNIDDSRRRVLVDDTEPSERCFCQKGHSTRPPLQIEFQRVFEAGLNKLAADTKLGSCQECNVSSNCQSGICLAGRCAENDTQMLQNGCVCSSSGDCESGLCQGLPIATTNVAVGDLNRVGTCEGRSVSCDVCRDATDCLSGRCTSGRCAEAMDGKLKTGCDCTSNLNCQSGRCVGDLISIGVTGSCAEKIDNTCAEPCLASNDCSSGLCGSIVCMPRDGTLLSDGCLATSQFECQSARSRNGVCVPLAGLCDICDEATDCATGRCTSGRCADSIGKLPNDCSCLSDSDCASGSCQSNTCQPQSISTVEPTTTEPTSNPSIVPSHEPTYMPSAGPSFYPSHWPSGAPTSSPTPFPSAPPTPGPSSPPSSDPTSGPTASPSSSPTSGPTASPSSSPTFGPSTSPSSSPTFEPTASPSSSPTFGPTRFPSAPPTFGPTTSPSSPPTFGPTTSPSDPPTSRPTTSPPTSVPTTSPSDLPSSRPTSRPSQSPTVTPPDCQAFPAGFVMSDVYAFCNSHSGVNQCCVGTSACLLWDTSSDYTVCRGSCRGQGSCYSLGQANLGINSCSERSACTYMGQAAALVTVGEGSCNGLRACEYLGDIGSASLQISIGINQPSCIGESACKSLGRRATTNINVMDNACIGDSTCYATAMYASSVAIGAGSCVSNLACWNCGNSVTGTFTITGQSCTY